MRGLFFGGTLAGILVGFGLGLALAWSYWPVSYSDADPADLRLDLKDDYLRMIASSYSVDGDMAHALQRLGALALDQQDPYISDLVRRESEPVYQQALTHLALALKQPSIALALPTFTPRPTKTRGQARPQPTALPHSTATSAPSILTLHPSTATAEPTLPPSTLVPNPDAPLFHVKSRSALSCLDTRNRGLIEVDVQDADGRPLPGIGVEVNWASGDEVFFTGLKPERGMGYADTEVPPGNYSVRLALNARSDAIEDLIIDAEPGECTGGTPQVRGWKLVFQRSG